MSDSRRASSSCDVAVVGAGAAGLATAIFARRRNRAASVVLLDGAARLGAKILVSGGGRCNVTNTVVSEADFWGGPRAIIRRVLRAFPVADTLAFFRGLGLQFHKETDGKLFPDTNRARDVLEALVAEVNRVGVTLQAGGRVEAVARSHDGFRLKTPHGVLDAHALVLATGGQSLPKSGSDGFGMEIARVLGHTVVPTTPALVPLLLAEQEPLHRALTGVALPVELSIWIDNRLALRLDGPMLWTHFGVSGPTALNASRHWLRAQLEARPCHITVGFVPGEDFAAIEERLSLVSSGRPKVTVQTAVADLVPASVSAALLGHLGIDAAIEMAHFARADRRRLSHALAALPLPVVGSRGYNVAEATAGGVALTEIDPSTMRSRVCDGLYFAGEILDVDGRLGGFNFQWAWSSGFVAGNGVASQP